jgi:glycosyltransferase involved in cell wall biosynthesis
MKVLHVIPATAPRYGGPSIAVHAMAKGVRDLGAEVTVATTDADGRGRLPVPHGRPTETEGVEYRYFPRSLPGEWKLSLPLGRWLHANAGRFDVVHVHALFSYATIPGCRAALRRSVPYVLRPLGTLDPWSLAQGSARKRPYLALVEGTHLRGAAAIHATSAAEAEGIAALGFGARVRVIPLGAEPASAPRTRGPGGPLRVLFLARLHPKKGLPLLLDAVAALLREGRAEVELEVAGDGDPAYRRELEARTRALGIAGRVRFLGRVEGSAKARALADADLFVLPSYQENFGIAAAEAMAAGLPVVVSDRVGIAEQVAEAGAGTVVPCDAAALAAAIRGAALDPEARLRAGERAAGLARGAFAWEHTSRRLLELYRELAAPAGRGG